MDGPEEFNIAVRNQLNHHENLVSFLPALWIAALSSKQDKYVGAAGLTWVAARALFAYGYASGDKKKRGPGFMLSFLVQNGLAITALCFVGEQLYESLTKK